MPTIREQKIKLAEKLKKNVKLTPGAAIEKIAKEYKTNELNAAQIYYRSLKGLCTLKRLEGLVKLFS